MSDAMPIAIVMLVVSVFSGICLSEAIYARIKSNDIILKTNDCLDMMTQTINDLHDICDRYLTKYNDLVDDYNYLLSAYTRAYGILEENGLLPGEEEQ